MSKDKLRTANKNQATRVLPVQTGCGTALIVPELSTEYLNAFFGTDACGLTDINLVLTAIINLVNYHRSNT